MSMKIKKTGWMYHQVPESLLPRIIELCQRNGFNHFQIREEDFKEVDMFNEDTYEIEAWRFE